MIPTTEALLVLALALNIFASIQNWRGWCRWRALNREIDGLIERAQAVQDRYRQMMRRGFIDG